MWCKKKAIVSSSNASSSTNGVETQRTDSCVQFQGLWVASYYINMAVKER